MLRILSLGAGVQSSAILLMSEAGELPRLDHAIFADTGDEPDEVYSWLEYLQCYCTTQIHVVGRDVSISDDVVSRIKAGRRLDKPPFFTHDGSGTPGIITRDCTGLWKINEIEKCVRSLLDLKPGQRWPLTLQVEQWLGISSDERQRMKVSTRPAVRFWHPLIEQEWTNDNQPDYRERMFSRLMCLDWMRENGFPDPPRSACWHCPFRSNSHWRHLRDNCPDDWAKAVEFDRELRAHGNIHGMRNPVYLHRSLKPLDEAPIDTFAESLFDNECGGVCGV